MSCSEVSNAPHSTANLVFFNLPMAARPSTNWDKQRPPRSAPGAPDSIAEFMVNDQPLLANHQLPSVGRQLPSLSGNRRRILSTRVTPGSLRLLAPLHRRQRVGECGPAAVRLVAHFAGSRPILGFSADKRSRCQPQPPSALEHSSGTEAIQGCPPRQPSATVAVLRPKRLLRPKAAMTDARAPLHNVSGIFALCMMVMNKSIKPPPPGSQMRMSAL